VKPPAIVYIAGPMSGLPDHNFPLFHAVAGKLRAAGYEVRNPAEHPAATAMTYREIIDIDIRLILECDTMFFLPRWYDSRSSKKEM
jgi:hypothetical protein